VVLRAVVYRSDPPQSQRAEVDRDDHVAIHTPMATAAALLAEGTLPPLRARSVERRVSGKPFEAMDFRELRLSSSGLGNTQAVILFEPSSTTGQTS